MGAVDKFFAWGAKKTIAMAFNTGFNTGSRGNGSKYRHGTSSSSPLTIIDNTSSLQQARQKYQDSPVAKGVIDGFSDMVVDVGVKLEPTPDADILGITEDAAIAWADDVKQKFHFWAKSKKSTRAEVLNYYQLQRLAVISQQRDGEYFVRFQYSNKRNLINPLQLTIIDPTQIRGGAYTYSTGPLAQDDGIIRDAGGKETGYKVWLQSQKAPFKPEATEIPARGTKSGRTLMVHGFMPEYAGQGRGHTRMFHAIQEFGQLTSYQLAELNKAGNQANVVGYVKPGKSAPATNVFESIGQDTTNPNIQTTATEEAASQNLKLNPLKEGTISDPGNMWVVNLREEEELKAFESTVSGEGLSKFQDAVVEYLAPSLGMPIEILKKKFGSNYSASRATLILAYRVYEIWRHELNSDLNDPVYEAWLSEMIAQGKIQALGWSDPLKKAAWLNNVWIGTPMPNIDPQKTATASETYMRMGATTTDRVALELNGSSAKKNIAKNNQTFATMDLPPWDKMAGQSGIENNNDDEDE